MTKSNDEVKKEDVDKFEIFGQNLGLFAAKVDDLSSSSLKKILKIMIGYPLAITAQDLENKEIKLFGKDATLNDEELSTARVACALKEQIIDLFLQEQYNDLNTQTKENDNE